MKRSLLQLVVRNVEARAAEGPAGLGDAELLRRFAETRDEASFNVLVARHGPLVWAVCRNLLPNETEAEDAFQATFLALIQSAPRVRTPAVGAWLHGVAVRVARMAKRSAGRRRRREIDAAAREATAPVAAAEWDELQAAVHEEVGRLPEALRVAFVLCGLQGKSQRDVAAELGWKPGTLSGRLAKARQQLLERLSKRGIAAGSVVAAVVGGSAAGIAGTPGRLVANVAALVRGGFVSTISPTILELARGATEVMMTRMKLMCLTFALMGLAVVGVTFVPFGKAQDRGAPGGGAPDLVGEDRALPTGGPAGSTPAKIGAWEYKYIARKSDRLDDFRKMLAANSAEGWEFVGTETLQVDAGSAAGPVLVFKRPNAAKASNVSGMTAPGTGGAGMIGSGFQMTGSGLGGNGLGGGAFGLGGGTLNRPATSGAPAPGRAPTKPGSSGPSPGSTAAPKRDIQVVSLKHAQAWSLAKSLQDLFGTDGSTRIIEEKQTNSLLIHADAQTFELLLKVIERLDMAAAKKSNN